jgi:hypothetical protein
VWISELRYMDPRTSTYLGSPSLVRLDDGTIVASHDYFGKGAPKNLQGFPSLSSIYRSVDDGLTWNNIRHISGTWWSTLFLLDGVLYLIGTSSQKGSIVIRRSEDGGYTWTHPVDGRSGLLFNAGVGAEPPNYHCAPVPVYEHNGRIYRAFEDDTLVRHGRDFSTLVVSAPVNCDLLNADNWTMSNKLAHDHDLQPQYGEKATWIEGNVLADPDGQLWNVLRFNGGEINRVAFVKITDDGATQSFDYETGIREMPGGATKFTIRRDGESGLYWSLVNHQQHPPEQYNRNRLTLVSSPDLVTWTHRKILLDDNLEGDRERSIKYTGFQYVDWIFDPANDGTILYLSRTAYDGAHNFHDSNRITFSRIRDFRMLVTE